MPNLPGITGGASQGLQSIFSSKKRVQFIQNNKTVITIDASMNEQHSRASPPTKFAVEQGTNISDHIILEPHDLEIHGIISDNPIGGLKGAITELATTFASQLIPPAGLALAGSAISLISALSGSKSPSVAAYAQLLQLQQNGAPFDVLTSLYRYPSMWISHISVPREAASGNALIFTVKLTQLLIVSPQLVNIQIFANPSLSANKTDTGNAGTGIPNGFSQGLSDTNAAIKNVVPGGIAGGAN